jgi:hypothetical protein
MTDRKPVPVIRLLSIAPLLLTLSSGAYSDSEPGIDCLLKAYPGFLLEKDGDNLVLADGRRLGYGSGSQGTFDDRLDHADLHDQMSQCYSPGFPVDQPGFNEDPGRMRHEPFFKRLYGEDKLAVQRNIVQVTWAPTGKSLPFSRIAGADQALIRSRQRHRRSSRASTSRLQPAGNTQMANHTRNPTDEQPQLWYRH